MKNLSISKKLIVGFGTVLALLLLSAALAFLSIGSLGEQIDLYGIYTVPNAEYLRSLQVSILDARFDMQEAVLSDDPEASQQALSLASSAGKQVISGLDTYAGNQRNHDRDADIERLRATFSEAAAFRAEIGALLSDRTEENLAKAREIYREQYVTKLDQSLEMLLAFSSTATERASQQRTQADAVQMQAWMTMVACAVVSTVLSVAVVISIRKSILTPVGEIVAVYTEIAKGNKQVNVTYEGRDELGQMATLIRSTNEQESRIVADIIDKFTKISQGDLQIEVDLDYPGDFADIQRAIESTATALNQTMYTISTAAEQVSVGADQVSGGAQALASGSTEQASSVEELGASITEIAAQAEENLSTIGVASEHIEQAVVGVATSNQYMQQLSQAMSEIASSSGQIANITKVIEDIAFQTNILALNAAIEAARAGAAGKGFAVVADEVRNLAGKSAQAARQTADLIEAAVDTVRHGTQITQQTAQALEKTGVNASKVTESFANIERASTEQAAAIEQIRDGLNQVASVVQQNAATAEENSATSEEMSAQAATLRQEVGKFKLAGRRRPDTPAFADAKRTVKPEVFSPMAVGKY